MLDQLYDHLVKARSLKCGDAMKLLLRDLTVMTDEELRELYQELLL